MAVSLCRIAKPIPMKRELKRYLHRQRTSCPGYCKAHPDEKGIETLDIINGNPEYRNNCKAHPDEKGIETGSSWAGSFRRVPDCKAHPDEKGIETENGWLWTPAHQQDCKAHPDEKGIETRADGPDLAGMPR